VTHMSEMRMAPIGAPNAKCAVCGFETHWRIAENDGHIPICRSQCETAWVFSRPYRSALTQIRMLLASDALGILDRIEHEATMALESNTGEQKP
jgi:hypothetical protein